MNETLDDIQAHASPCMHVRDYPVTCCGDMAFTAWFKGTDPCTITAVECLKCGRVLPVSNGRVMPRESRDV